MTRRSSRSLLMRHPALILVLMFALVALAVVALPLLMPPEIESETELDKFIEGIEVKTAAKTPDQVNERTENPVQATESNQAAIEDAGPALFELYKNNIFPVFPREHNLPKELTELNWRQPQAEAEGYLDKLTSALDGVDSILQRAQYYRYRFSVQRAQYYRYRFSDSDPGISMANSDIRQLLLADFDRYLHRNKPEQALARLLTLIELSAMTKYYDASFARDYYSALDNYSVSITKFIEAYPEDAFLKPIFAHVELKDSVTLSIRNKIEQHYYMRYQAEREIEAVFRSMKPLERMTLRLINKIIPNPYIDNMKRLSRELALIKPVIDEPPYKIVAFMHMQHPDDFENWTKDSIIFGIYYFDQVNALLIKAALMKYHEREETFPDSLDSLVPDLLPFIPHDCLTNKPLNYVRTTEGFTLMLSDEARDLFNAEYRERYMLIEQYPYKPMETHA